MSAIAKGEHPASYYAATARYPQPYPRLESDLEAEICVIGGGYSGVNTAIELAERGYNVVVLEARRIGWGASGRNGGQLIRGIGHGLEAFRNTIGREGIESIQHMGLEAVQIAVQRIKQYNIDCDLKLGYLDLADKPRHMKDFAEEKAWLDSVDYPFDTYLVEKSGLPDVIGSDKYLGGLVDTGSGHLHPLNLIAGEAAVAQRLGVRLFEKSPVIKIRYGDTCKVTTELGSIRADRLVICGNAYVAGLNDHLEARVAPAGSYIIATEPLPETLWRRVLPQDMAACDQRVVPEYFRLSADQRLLFGSRCHYSGRDPDSIVAKIRPRMLKAFPYLKDVTIDYEWGGMLGIGANRLPQIGRLAPNVYYAQAYSGHGVNATHLAARLIAESIHGESDRIAVFEKVKHLKFPGSRNLRSQLLALGMVYFRFKDMF